MNKPELPPLPAKFVSFGTKWHTFAKGFKGHCGVSCGCMNIPLIYVLHEHTDVTAAMHAAEYPSTDDHLIACVVCTARSIRKTTIVFGTC